MKISLVYIIMPFVVLFIAPKIKLKKKDNRKIIIWMFGISYIIMCGLRDGGGADDAAYRLYYEQGYGGGIFQMFAGKEPLFNLLRLICGFLQLNYKGLFLAYAIITAFFMCKALENFDLEKKSLVLYIASFYFICYSGMFTTMRQAVAMAMLFYMYSCNKLSWNKRVLIWLAIVCTHYGFVLLLPFEIIFTVKNYNFNMEVRILIPIFAFGVGKFLSLDGIVEKITSFLGLYDYMNSNNNYNTATGIGIVTLVLFALYLLKCAVEYRTRQKTVFKTGTHIDVIGIDMINTAQMMYFTLIFLAMNMRWGNRICYYYLLFVPFLIENALSHFTINESKEKLRTIAIVALYLCFILIMMQYFGTTGYQWSLNFWG